MVTKEQLKREIDFVQEEYLMPLYKIIKTFEQPGEDFENGDVSKWKRKRKKEEWLKFINKYAGSLADTPIERGDQGNFEVREELI